MDRSTLLQFLSERSLDLHREYLENCRMRMSIIAKSGYPISGKGYLELYRLRLGDAREEILNLALETYLHEVYFDSFGNGGEHADCIKERYRTTAGFLYELERMAMATNGGFIMVSRGKRGVEISHIRFQGERIFAEPCLALDLAEHAYFLDYGFDKLSYVRSALARLSLSKLDK